MTNEKTKAEILAEVISDEAVAKRQAEGVQRLIDDKTHWAEYHEKSAKTESGWMRAESLKRARIYRAKLEALKEVPAFKENEWKSQAGRQMCKPVDECKVVYTDNQGRSWYNLSLRVPYSEMRAIEETFTLNRNRRNYGLRNTLRLACGLPELVGFNPDPLSRYVKGLRNKYGISQRELAEATGINQSYISQMENSELTKEPLLSHLKSLAKFDGIPLLKLLRLVEVVKDD